jgi:hypothetical protein
MQEDLTNLIQELKLCKYNYCGDEAIAKGDDAKEKTRRRLMLPGVFAHSFTTQEDMTLAYAVVTRILTAAEKLKITYEECFGEYLKNYCLLQNKQTTGKLCFSKLEEPLAEFMLKNIDIYINAIRFCIYGNNQIEKKLPAGFLAMTKAQAEKLYFTSLERSFMNVKSSNPEEN